MKQTKIMLLITALGVTSCSDNGSVKNITSNIKAEFIEDSTKTKDKYVGNEVELTGYFNNEDGKWSFEILDSNILNQEDDSTDENTQVSDFAKRIHGMRLGINTDLENNAITSQNIISPLKMSGGYWIYDKSKDRFYNTEQWGNIADVIEIVSKNGGMYRNVEVLDSVTNNSQTVDLKVNDTTVEMLDSHLAYWVKDISAIQSNNIMYLPVRKYQKTKVVDVVTIKGKVEEVTERSGEYAVVGLIDILVINLKNVKILKKERVNTGDFTLLDYQAKRNMMK